MESPKCRQQVFFFELNKRNWIAVECIDEDRKKEELTVPTTTTTKRRFELGKRIRNPRRIDVIKVGYSWFSQIPPFEKCIKKPPPPSNSKFTYIYTYAHAVIPVHKITQKIIYENRRNCFCSTE